MEYYVVIKMLLTKHCCWFEITSVVIVKLKGKRHKSMYTAWSWAYKNAEKKIEKKESLERRLPNHLMGGELVFRFETFIFIFLFTNIIYIHCEILGKCFFCQRYIVPGSVLQGCSIYVYTYISDAYYLTHIYTMCVLYLHTCDRLIYKLGTVRNGQQW
jgi:hypothetical protein